MNKVTQEQINELMAKAEIKTETVFGKCTLVTVRLENGFVFTASSGCVDAANYDETLGKEICLRKIEDELWKMVVYALQKALYDGTLPADLTPKQRVERELADLRVKYEKLCAFIESVEKTSKSYDPHRDKFVVDENDENFKRAAKRVNLELLYRQREIMREYISILANRLALWND